MVRAAKVIPPVLQQVKDGDGRQYVAPGVGGLLQ
jgi:hypothetical protein